MTQEQKTNWDEVLWASVRERIAEIQQRLAELDHEMDRQCAYGLEDSWFDMYHEKYDLERELRSLESLINEPVLSDEDGDD